jgi:glucose-1-phosphate adenylyltransferase
MIGSTLYLEDTQQAAKLTNNQKFDMSQVSAIILGGGAGTRLHPLTLERCKPSVPFAGNFCLIDVPLSYCLAAGCGKTFVITQFLASSLHRHIYQTYHQSGKSIEILTAEQRPDHQGWFEGTADAVRKNLHYILESQSEYFLILAGDQLFQFDFRLMLQCAQQNDADLLIATLPVHKDQAHRFGILKINENDLITDFQEKPQKASELKKLNSSRAIMQKMGESISKEKEFLGSMGIYLFKRQALIDLLQKDRREDFGKHLIPTQIEQGNAYAFLYDGYWEDLGSIKTYYEANMAFTSPRSPINLYNQQFPLIKNQLNLPPTKIFHTKIDSSLICDGAFIEAQEINQSIIGPRSVIYSNSVISDSYLIGNDYYCSSYQSVTQPLQPRIGKNCTIKRAIIDKNVQIGDNVTLVNKESLQEFQCEWFCVKEGIIIVPSGTTIPSNTVF